MNDKIIREVENMSEEEVKEMLVNIIGSAYHLVTWPESQNLMEEPWFEEEAILDIEGRFGSSSFFIPLKRLYEKS